MHTASTSPVHLIHLLGSARHQADAAAKAAQVCPEGKELGSGSWISGTSPATSSQGRGRATTCLRTTLVHSSPSTMAAILNSLQMSYQTFRLQKRTDDVLRVLSAVKAELPRYQAALRRAQQQIETAGKTVEGIITTRTNVMERKLKDIDALEDTDQADEILGLTSAGLLADQKDED